MGYEMEIIKIANPKLGLILLIFTFSAHGTTYNFPGTAPVNGAMAAGDIFNINSSTFLQATEAATDTIALNSGVQLNIQQAGIVTYTGTSLIASTVYLDCDLANPTTVTVNGQLNAGNAKFAFFSEKGVIVTSTLTMSVTGIGVVNGDIYLDAATTSQLVVDSQGSINGNVFFDQNPGNLTIGKTIAHQGYYTNGNITGINTLDVHLGTMQNNNVLTFSTAGARSLTIDANATFINNGSISNVNTIAVTGTFQLNQNITVGTSISNAAASGTIQVNNAVVVTTPSFNITNGQYIASFTGLNAFGTLTLPNTNFVADGNSSDSFMFIRQSGYLPAGQQILVTGNNPPVMPASVSTNANNDIFINSLVISAQNNNIILTVNRNTFDTLANSDFNAAIGQALEYIGNNNPSNQAISSLNWFESATSASDFNNKLNVFKMLISLPTPSLDVQYKVFATVSDRLAAVRKNSYIAGENYFINELWFKISTIKAKQQAYQNLLPYTSSTYNLVFGIDSAITGTDRLGMALSLADSNIKSDVTNFSTFLTSNNTKVLSFQATPYYLREFSSGYYVNLIAGMTFNLYKTQTYYTNLSVLSSNINNSRSDVLFSLQSILGTSFIMMDYLHVAVSGSLIGSYAYREPFNDQTIPGIGLQINPNSGAYITVSPKIEFSFPWQYDQIVFYPKLYMQYFYDLFGSDREASGHFLTSDEVFATNISHRKARALIGAALDFDLNEQWSLDFNYDYEFNPEFSSKQFTLTAKYRF
jgi:hypothetical protein